MNLPEVTVTFSGATIDRHIFRCVFVRALPRASLCTLPVGLVNRTAVRLPVASVRVDCGMRLSLPV